MSGEAYIKKVSSSPSTVMAIVELVGATYAAVRTCTVKVRRTSGTPADVASATITVNIPIVTALTQTFMAVPLPLVSYVATAGAVLTLFGAVEAIPDAGSVQVSAAWISALRVA